MTAIRRLPENLINRIAAGEVVERPASAVKELVENALDAGAGRIDVTLRDGGQSLISVSDDGRGMTAEELSLAIERHATSKLPSDDLLNIHTLGFRGEALPSIGAVSRLKISSRAAAHDDAFSISVDGGKISDIEPSARPSGTLVDVRDLFFATPARLKFLKTPRTEQGHVVDIINTIAMAHPGVSFRLNDGARDLVNLEAAQGELFEARLKRFAKIIGRDFADNAIKLDAERDGVRLQGHISLPTFNRGNGAKQFFFVNGRPVRDKLFFGAVRGAYRDFLSHDRHPVLALFIEISPELVDVNVHPAKTEVRFRDSGLVRGLVVGGIKHALASSGHRASTTVSQGALGAIRTDFSPRPALNGHQGLTYGGQENQAYRPSSGAAEGFRDYHSPLGQEPLTGLSSEPNAPAGMPDDSATSGQASPQYPLGVARAQLHETYIVAQTGDGIVIVDQHAAHERLTHEKIKKAMDDGGVARQGLLIPEVVELDGASADRVLARVDELAEMGLVVEGFGAGAIAVREVPSLLGDCDIQGLIKDLADDLAEVGEAIHLKERLGEICATMACHSSIRAGRRLNGDEMNRLLRSMEATPHSGQCSHGRPTYVELKLSDIEKLFGRR